eukprot:GHVP01005754.1.p1 GENE.GHVP01005754.1~~GHVP01005754.1.p1  ORF type:complete len:808 (-),score=128.74 GHVP01005754.1:1585-3969(-)
MTIQFLSKWANFDNILNFHDPKPKCHSCYALIRPEDIQNQNRPQNHRKINANHLYFDMKVLLEKAMIRNPLTVKEFFRAIGQYLDASVRYNFSVRRSIFIALDGSLPAFLIPSIKRRQNEESIFTSQSPKAEQEVPPLTSIKSGTEFYHQLGQYLTFWAANRAGCKWTDGVTLSVSPPSAEGSAEVKILSQIRRNEQLDSKVSAWLPTPNPERKDQMYLRHLIVADDWDSLCSTAIQGDFSQYIGISSKRSIEAKCPKCNKLQSPDFSVTVKVQEAFLTLCPEIKFVDNLQDEASDFVLMCLLSGNDILPPIIKSKEEMKIALETYMKLLRKNPRNRIVGRRRVTPGYNLPRFDIHLRFFLEFLANFLIEINNNEEAKDTLSESSKPKNDFSFSGDSFTLSPLSLAKTMVNSELQSYLDSLHKGNARSDDIPDTDTPLDAIVGYLRHIIRFFEIAETGEYPDTGPLFNFGQQHLVTPEIILRLSKQLLDRKQLTNPWTSREQFGPIVCALSTISISPNIVPWTIDKKFDSLTTLPIAVLEDIISFDTTQDSHVEVDLCNVCIKMKQKLESLPDDDSSRRRIHDDYRRHMSSHESSLKSFDIHDDILKLESLQKVVEQHSNRAEVKQLMERQGTTQTFCYWTGHNNQKIVASEISLLLDRKEDRVNPNVAKIELNEKNLISWLESRKEEVVLNYEPERIERYQRPGFATHVVTSGFAVPASTSGSTSYATRNDQNCVLRIPRRPIMNRPPMSIDYSSYGNFPQTLYHHDYRDHTFSQIPFRGRSRGGRRRGFSFQ